jgi:hypothetical protein
MTDEPTKDPFDQPTQPASSTTPPSTTPPSESSGVGFAAIRPPDQQAPATPPGPAGNQAAAPPPPLPGPVYQYDYSRIPQNRGSGSSVLLVGAIAFLLVLFVGLGAMFALAVGPFARATQSPMPTFVAQPSATAGLVTPAPTGVIASPAPSPTGVAPSAPPNDHPKAALLSHIPPQIADSCLVTAPDDPGAILAIAVCDADGGDIRVTYFLYATYESMFSAYSGFRFASQIEPDSGDCDDPATWPTENSYQIGDVTVGRLLCTEELSETSLYWTDDRLNILSQATHTKGDHERLIEFWRRESGPDL